jgi:predicted DNA-binding transcriptional regulator AlpA
MPEPRALGDRQRRAALPGPPNGQAATPALLPLLIDLRQLAHLLSVSPRTCKRLAFDGTLPPACVVRIGRRRVFNRLLVEEWVRQGCRPANRGGR